MKKISIALLAALVALNPVFANNKVGQFGIKTHTDCAAASVADGSCLPLSSQIFDNGSGTTLDQAIANGLLGITWSVVTGTTQTLAKFKAYVASNASRIIFTLPTTAAVGDTFTVAGLGAGGWKVALTSGQVINYNNTNTGTGSGFGVQSVDQYSAVTIICSVANTTFQVVNGQGSWAAFPNPYSASYLAVAGGGGSGEGNSIGGGGGAGGLLTGTTTLTPGTTYPVTVGGGGAGTVSGVTQVGTNGGNSIFGSIATAIGGGGGGSGNGVCLGPNAGGSGGGAGAIGTTSPVCFGGAPTAGQGFVGGNSGGFAGCPGVWIGGGGGGASAAGGVGGCTSFGGSGAGGNGVSSSITGSPVTYAGGGGGADSTGGSGGGGSGVGSSCSGTNGLGAGGGAFTYNCNGGSGVVIISVPTSSYSGITTGSPTVTTSGGNTIIKFTANGSYTG